MNIIAKTHFKEPTKAPTVLVVDDDPSVRKLILAALRKTDCQVVEAVTGQEGFQRATDLRPDLILMDIYMPDSDFDGLEATRLIKDDPRTKACHVLIVTGMRTVDEKVCIESGALGILVKPFSPVKLRKWIERLFEDRKEAC